MVVSILIIVLCILCVFAAGAAGQAWVQPRGAYFLKLSGNYLYATEEWSVDGDKQPIAADDPRISGAWFRDLSIYAYLEYGVTDHFTLVSSVPYKYLTSKFTQDPGGGAPTRTVTLENQGLGDWWISLRTPLSDRFFALSLQGGVKIPLYTEPESKGFLTVPPLGTAATDAEIGVYLGKSLYPVPAYVSAGIAYRVRGGTVHDEVPFNAEVGYTLQRLFAKIRIDGVRNTTQPGGSVIAGDEDYVKLSPTIAFSLSDSFVLAAEAFHVLWGRNTIAGTTYSLGIVFLGGRK